MPTITRTTPLNQTIKANETGTAQGTAQHEVQVGAVVQASTKGAGGVDGEITANAETAGIQCVSADEMLAALANPAVTGAASAAKGYSIAAKVDMDVVVNMQAEAEAMASVVGDVIKDQGKVELPCTPSDGAPIGEPIPQTPGQQHPGQTVAKGTVAKKKASEQQG